MTDELNARDEGPAEAKPIHSLNGAGLLLNILGGLIVGMVVASVSPFVKFILGPFSLDSVNQPVQPPTEAILFAVAVYSGFLLNVFRQIHGLGIVFEDKDYQLEVGQHLSRRGRFLAFLSAVLVMTFAGLLLGVVRSSPEDPLQALLALPADRGFAPAMWILVFHLLTVLSYWLWDYVAGTRTSASVVPTSPADRFGLRWKAASYADFIANWKRLAMVSSLVAILVVVFVFFASQWFSPRSVSLIPMFVLTLLTFGYSITDYVCNSRFYFRRYRLDKTREEGEEGDMSNPSRTIVIVTMSVLVVGIAWLAIRTGTSPVAEPKVTLQLKWVYNAGFAGDLVAKNQEDIWDGLHVEVLPGGIGVDPIKAVTTGVAQFGVATGDQLLLAAEQSTPLVALALVYQENPLSWIVKADSGIDQPADLRNRNVGVTFIDDEALFRSMLRRAGLTQDDITIVPVKFDTSPFIRGDVDAYPVFRNTQGVEIAKELEKSGVGTRFVSPADVGVISYSNLYFTTRQYMDRHPGVVAEFVKGVLSAWRFAQLNPAEAAKIIKTFDDENSLEVIEASVVETNQLVKLPTTHNIGEMTLAGWDDTQTVLLDSSVLKNRVEIVQHRRGEPLPKDLPQRALVFTNAFIR